MSEKKTATEWNLELSERLLANQRDANWGLWLLLVAQSVIFGALQLAQSWLCHH